MDAVTIIKLIYHLNQRALWLEDRARLAEKTGSGRISHKTAALVLENLATAIRLTARDLGYEV